MLLLLNCSFCPYLDVAEHFTYSGGEEADAVAALNAELDGALTSLNRKLIELHSRLKERKLSQILINRSISSSDPDQITASVHRHIQCILLKLLAAVACFCAILITQSELA